MLFEVLPPPWRALRDVIARIVVRAARAPPRAIRWHARGPLRAARHVHQVCRMLAAALAVRGLALDEVWVVGGIAVVEAHR